MTVMSFLDLRSGYFQLAGNPSDDSIRYEKGYVCIPVYTARAVKGGSQFLESDRYLIKTGDREVSTRGLLATDHVIWNHGQVTWTTPELAPPFLTTTPHQREDVSALDRFNVHRCPTWWVFSGTGLELVTRKATIRYLYHSATAATLSSREQLMEEQRKDPDLGDIYRYLENPEDSSFDATICENWSRDFRVIVVLCEIRNYVR
ncbi:uncharacterized protein TNCV_190041 [Trichonephila clavipes]|nr:uncharacterized protein TNCV_190041 [Trichonephila clavipes]